MMHQLPTELDLTDVCFVNNDTGFVSAGGLFTNGIVLRTNNGGVSWDTVMLNNQGVNSISYRNQFLTISESGSKLHTSSDLTNWSLNYVNQGWWGWHNHVRLNDNRVYLVGGENFGRGTIHVKDPNHNYTILKDTFEHELRDIELTSERTLFAVGYGLIMKSTDEGNSWIISNIQGDFFRGVDFPSSNTGYVVGEYGSVYKTTNRGNSWSQCRAGNSIFADQSKLLRDIAFLDENKGFIVGTGNQVFKTEDGGKTWMEVLNLDGYADFYSLSIYNNKAYLAGNKGQLLVLDLNP
ncbi:MAG: YCF48-related protein [Saprospiraceae bacterium]|nr:YCF48-related protein [Saprospiraceae bacterium]